MDETIYSALEEQSESAQTSRDSRGNADSSKAYDPQEYAAKKKAERDGLYAEIDETLSRVSENPVALKDYLDVMARLGHYSLRNTLLIYDHMPEASRLGDFDYWKEQGASVLKGQKALSILAPGDEYTKEDGSIGRSFNVKGVFDVSQTSARNLKSQHPDAHTLLLALIENTPAPIEVVDLLTEGNGCVIYDQSSNSIKIAKGLDEGPLLKMLVVEMSQATLAQTDRAYDHEGSRETASLAAYVVAGRYGADNSALMPVLSTSPESTPADMREKLSSIRGVANALSDRVDETLQAKATQEIAPALKQARSERDGAR